jgi:uridine kinase
VAGTRQRAFWDFSVFLDVPFAVTALRMAERDGTHPDPTHPSMRRYVEAQRIYFAACTPTKRASVVIDNSDFDAPRITATARLTQGH